MLQSVDSRTPFPCPVSPNVDGVGAMDTLTGTRGHSDSSDFQIRLLAR